LILLADRMKARTDADLGVGTRVEHLPDHPPAFRIQRSQPTADTEILAGVSHDHLVTDEDRRRRQYLALFRVGHDNVPYRHAIARPQCRHMPILRREKHVTTGHRHAAARRAATLQPVGHRGGHGVSRWRVAPNDRRLVLCQVDGIDRVRKGRQHEQRAAVNLWRGRVSAGAVGAESEDLAAAWPRWPG
jgi:hypothetical protein